MLFNSFVFAAFFAVFMIVYWGLARHVVAQNVLIVVGSWVFYGWWDARFLILIIASIVTDYVCGWGASGGRIDKLFGLRTFVFLWVSSFAVLGIAGPESYWIAYWLVGLTAALLALVSALRRLSEHGRRKAYVTASVVINLGILGVFKYFNFFADQLQAVAGTFGWNPGPVTLNVILPVGISFYTFQTMSYTIDCYRRDVKATDRIIELTAYVSFFPQLVAGPIERAQRLLPQFFERRTLTKERAYSAIWLFLWGLFKKVVVADNLAVVADAVFNEPKSYGSGALLAGLIAFTFQIYCDFSGYSDMARGTARLLGFELMVNFKLPYVARTPSEFWQRWHISLSSWLRDYLYIPLGGNRLGPLYVYRNLALTMLLGGLWHGANWTFVAWGAYQGLILIVYRVFAVDERLARDTGSTYGNAARDAVAIAVMFTLTVVGWLFFRANSLEDVGVFTAGLLHFRFGESAIWASVLPLVVGLLFVEMLQLHRKRLEVFGSVTGIAGLTLKSMLVYSLIFLAAHGSHPFIYFDF